MSEINQVEENSSLISTLSDLTGEINHAENNSLLSTLSDLTGEINPAENSSLLSTLSDLISENNTENSSFLEKLSQINSQNEPIENSISPKDSSEEIPTVVMPKEQDGSELNRIGKPKINQPPIESINTKIPSISAPQNDDFFNQMENMFDDITIDLLFIHNKESSSFEELTYKYAIDTSNKGNYTNKVKYTNKEKLRQIFDYFRDASVITGGSLSLTDFKFFIKNKISEIRPKISQ